MAVRFRCTVSAVVPLPCAAPGTTATGGGKRCNGAYPRRVRHGQELAAHALHTMSARARKNMITVNCPALPKAILESELFGHHRGAFTGANQDKAGLFQEADDSTICLMKSPIFR